MQQGSEIIVHVENQGDTDATVHWHGLRLENRYDGTHETQAPILVGDRFSARVTFPDPGVYWYHPHIREDYGQEMGLYGNILVEPAEADYWPPANREVASHARRHPARGREGRAVQPRRDELLGDGPLRDVLLVSGEPDLSLTAQLGEVVRLYLTNTANTRVFKVALPGARMKLVGGDSGHVEHEQFVDDVILAPSERVVVDVLFDQPGELRLEHHTPERVYPLAAIQVSEDRAEPSLEQRVRGSPDQRRHGGRAGASRSVSRRRARQDRLRSSPRWTWGRLKAMRRSSMPARCIPKSSATSLGHCPKCGMKLLPVEAPATTYACPMHPEVVSDEPGHCPKCGMKLLPSLLVAGRHGARARRHEHEGHDTMPTKSTTTRPPTASSGRTTWSRSTG